MIRINLLEGARRERETKPEVGPAAATFQAQVFIGALLVAGVVVGGVYWFLSHRLAELNKQMDVERREAARLAAIQAENTRYEADLKDIDRRIAAVQTLEDNRHGPTQLMMLLAGMVNRAPGLYLISVTPKEGRLLFNGASSSVTSIADFFGALNAAGNFRDVQLREYYEDDDKDGRVNFKFSLDCVYSPAGQTAAVSAQASGKPGNTPPAPARGI
jgi:Tfp pilus assembly protein PilN